MSTTDPMAGAHGATMADRHARAALDHLDAAVGEKGEGLSELMARAMREMVGARDDLTARMRAGHAAGDRLDRVNAVLSLVYSAAYPIVGVRRERIEHARNALRDLLKAHPDGL